MIIHRTYGRSSTAFITASLFDYWMLVFSIIVNLNQLSYGLSHPCKEWKLMERTCRYKQIVQYYSEQWHKAISPSENASQHLRSYIIAATD